MRQRHLKLSCRVFVFTAQNHENQNITVHFLKPLRIHPKIAFENVFDIILEVYNVFDPCNVKKNFKLRKQKRRPNLGPRID